MTLSARQSGTLFAFGIMGVAFVDLDTYEVPLVGVALMGAVWLAAFLAQRSGAWFVLSRHRRLGVRCPRHP